MKSQFIKDLKPGISVDTTFLLAKKAVKKKKNGGDFCSLVLQDNSGSIDAIAWTETCMISGLSRKGAMEEGDFVKVKGEVSEYRGAAQLEINDISREDEKNISYSDFIRSSPRDLEEMVSELKSFIKSIDNIFLKSLLGKLFDDDIFMGKFTKWPAAVQYHHAYLSGLLEHTLAMAKICDYISSVYENADRDLIISGAILHDIGKISEYGVEKNGALLKITDEGKLLGHIAIGYGMIKEKIDSISDFPGDLKDRLLHIILSHHGHKEFGSPKRPKTIESFIVYHADHLDADIGGFNFVLENNSHLADWSEYLKNFERSVYLKKMDGNSHPQENSNTAGSLQNELF